ncbi:capsular polysaccharide biosynthesis protein [Aliigemmobacter aestuarii]|uniref:capsular polysaccharide biosynthesis protein n=1 Tax=Aliigemmobacter aestuarii TaxID=1445661 RepID=UPI001FE9E8A8|nr:capsular polysaccharide biosynthesis protein [Gemmobacter aestuarii]
MTEARAHSEAAGAIPRRLYHFNAGFLRQRRLREILAAAGHSLHLGKPRPGDGIVVWGRSPYARRGEAMAARTGLPLIRVEDAFLRSVRPGRMGGAGPLGLLIDPFGVHFDATAPSLIEHHLMTDPLDNSDLLTRARDGIARLQASDLSKYNIHEATPPLPPAGYVLVIDQTRGDASIRHSGADATTFARMLTEARLDHPRARIVIKTHPETALGLRGGHFGQADCDDRTTLCADPVSPWRLLEGAIAVYVVSSQMGFEAILAGHRPRVFGQPFYAGWGLTEDEQPIPRRTRQLTRAQLFAGAMILAPTWYDPCRGRLCSFEEAVDQLEAEVRAFREDRQGHVALGMRLWKRPHLQDFFGRERALRFADSAERAMRLAAADGRSLMVWAGREPPGLPPATAVRRVEDGFLRSRGLGAGLVPPLSLVADDLGIYYDPSRPSRLEALIAAAPPPGGVARAERLRARIVAAGVTKYNLRDQAPPADPGEMVPVLLAEPPPDRDRAAACDGRLRLLVPGQVEDDASIRLGGGEIRTNLGLLRRARAAHPEALITYKPHPDVEAGLRPGTIAEADLRGLADHVAHQADPLALLARTDEVWTMTSLLGFEALLRGIPVTCLGAPFYAGWGLTRDLGPVPERRLRAPDGHPLPRPPLAQLVHAALIAYPRYRDPQSGLPCPPEVIVDRLAGGPLPRRGLANRLLAKAQGALAAHAWLWRR